jgi:hypothetical protein
MERHPTRPARLAGAGSFSNARRRAAGALLLLALLATPVLGATPPSFEARAGLDIAESAAHVWADDAVLVYVENDESLDANGQAARWGYLYYSPSLAKSRAYSVRNGKILVAENLEMKLDPPPVTRGWIDSGVALAEAENSAGRDFCKEHGGRLGTMLLMRGAFNDSDPDQTTWTLIYTAPHAPSLFVVVDAAEGKVRKTWRG